MNPKGRGIFKKAKPMNSFSVPSAEHDSGEPSHRFAWGRIARQPSEHIASGWLARTYDQFAEKFIDDLEYNRKSTRLNSSHVKISYAVFCLKKKKRKQ